MREDFLQQAVQHLNDMKTNKAENDGDIYSRSWGLSFNKLDEEQKLFAKKAIDEILILGQLKQLSLNIVPSISPSPPTSLQSSSYSLSRSSPPLDNNPPCKFNIIENVVVTTIC